MIVTLTANPSLDRTMALAAPLSVGEVQTAVSSREDAGGKGINVARAVMAAGESCVAVLPLAPEDPFAGVLRLSGVQTSPVAVAGRVRTNLAVTDPAGVTTKLNLPGAVLSDADCAALVDAVVAAATQARWLILAGSLPPGAPGDFYVEVIQAVRAAHGASGPRIAVDTSGPALTAVVERGRPDLIKPNDAELGQLTGFDATSEDAAATVVAVARTIVPHAVGAALVTLGAQGAVLITSEGAWAAAPPPIHVLSTVGAGDSALAGYILAESRGAVPEDRLRLAVRYGAAAASLPGTLAPRPGDLPAGAVPVTSLA
jgi:1-phosphofructokinase